jgi:hypothetical protein
MKKRYLALGLIAIITIGLFAGRAVMVRREYVRELEAFRAQDFEGWVSAQRGVASNLDRALGEVLVSPSERQTIALENALQQAYRGQEVFWRVGIPHAVYNAADNWGYRYKYQEMAAYLQYLLARDEVASLTAMERENLTLMRSYTDAFYDGFSALVPSIHYQITDRRGNSLRKYHPWHSIVDNQDMIDELRDLGHKVNLFPEVGASDPGYFAYRKERDQAGRNFEHYGLLHSGEREYSEEERLSRAIEFLKERLHFGDITTPEGVQATESLVAYTDIGLDSAVGGFTVFALKGTDTEWVYNIGVTEIGGHIFQIGTEGKSGYTGANLLHTADILLTKWAEFEGIALEHMRLEERGETVTMVYAPVIDQVIHTDKAIHVTVNLPVFPDISHQPIVINADRYFALYNAPSPGVASLTPEDAVKSLSSSVTPTGDPRLELCGERLVYAIPVEGVNRVNTIYIDAITGEYAWMEYDYSRP